jgi:hypothetical protein
VEFCEAEVCTRLSATVRFSFVFLLACSYNGSPCLRVFASYNTSCATMLREGCTENGWEFTLRMEAACDWACLWPQKCDMLPNYVLTNVRFQRIFIVWCYGKSRLF